MPSLGCIDWVTFAWFHSLGCIKLACIHLDAFSWMHSLICIHLVAFTSLNSLTSIHFVLLACLYSCHSYYFKTFSGHHKFMYIKEFIKINNGHIFYQKKVQVYLKFTFIFMVWTFSYISLALAPGILDFNYHFQRCKI